jgi:hypothetical protein
MMGEGSMEAGLVVGQKILIGIQARGGMEAGLQGDRKALQEQEGHQEQEVDYKEPMVTVQEVELETYQEGMARMQVHVRGLHQGLEQISVKIADFRVLSAILGPLLEVFCQLWNLRKNCLTFITGRGSLWGVRKIIN